MTDRKSYVFCRLAPRTMIFNDLESYFAVWNLSNSHTSRNVVCTCIMSAYNMFTHKLESARGL